MTSKRLTPITFLASVCGAGFIPFAPGTMGSIVAFIGYLLLPESLFMGLNQLWFSLGVLVLTLVSIILSGKAEKVLGRDAPQIVIDEAAGYYFAVLLLPQTLMVGLYALVLFRVFDIAKPWPINISQRLPGGWGVTVDDLIAGVFANIVIRILLLIVPRFFGQ